MNRFDKTRLAAAAIALVFAAMAGMIVMILWFEMARAQPIPREEPEIYYGPEIPKCDKELWLRIKDGCNDE